MVFKTPLTYCHITIFISYIFIRSVDSSTLERVTNNYKNKKIINIKIMFCRLKNKI